MTLDVTSLFIFTYNGLEDHLSIINIQDDPELILKRHEIFKFYTTVKTMA